MSVRLPHLRLGPLRRAALTGLLWPWVGGALSGQIYALTPRSAEVERRFEERLIDWGSRRVLLVEIHSGVELDPETGVPRLPVTGRCEFFAADSADPEKLPYRLKDGRKLPRSARDVLVLQGADIGGLQPFLADESFASLAQEYRRRAGELEQLQRRRDAAASGDESWSPAQGAVVRATERLAGWLSSTGYREAALRAAAQAQEERTRWRRAEGSARLEEALAAIHPVAVPEELKAVSQELTGGQVEFRAVESRHFRIVAVTEVAESRLLELLELAERVLEDFRGSTVDPYAGAFPREPVPPRIFQEFFFGPAQDEWYAEFLPAYYGHDWGERRAEHLKAHGIQVHRPGPVHFLDYWRLSDGLPLEGIIVHQLGHALAEYVYLDCRPEVGQDWLREGLGRYLSIAQLGRNDVCCRQWQEAERYQGGTARRGEGQKIGGQGLRLGSLRAALASDRPLAALLPADLYELSEADLAKAWALVDWLLTTQGQAGQRWLRRAAAAGWSRPGFLDELRQAARDVFDLTGAADPLLEIEQRWRAAAQAQLGL